MSVGEGDLLPGRRIKGKKLISQNRRVGEREDLALAIRCAGDSNGVGEPFVADRRVCDALSRPGRVEPLLSVLPRRRTKQSNRRLIRASKASAEHVPMAALAPTESCGLGATGGPPGGSPEELGATSSVCAAPDSIVVVVVPCVPVRQDKGGRVDVTSGVDKGPVLSMDVAVCIGTSSFVSGRSARLDP